MDFLGAALHDYVADAENVRVDEVRRLLAAGASVEYAGEFGKTALHQYMGRSGADPAVVRALLDAGARVDLPETCCGCTPVHLCLMAANIDVEVLRMLVHEGRVEDCGRAELASVVLKEFVVNRAFDENVTERVMRVLVAAGANVNAASVVDRTPLHVCLTGMSTHPGTIAALLRFGADVNAVDLCGMSPLAVLVRSRAATAELVRMLLDAGADAHAVDSRLDSLLHQHFQSARPRPEVVRELIRHGCSPRARNRIGNTPLHEAAKHSSCKHSLVGPLLAAGASVDARNNTGKTPLHLAAASNPRACRRLIALGADVVARSYAGVTPLAQLVADNNSALVTAALNTQPEPRAVAESLRATTPVGETACSRLCVAYVVARAPSEVLGEPERALHAAFVAECLAEVAAIHAVRCGTPPVSLLEILVAARPPRSLLSRRAWRLAESRTTVYRAPLRARIAAMRHRSRLVERALRTLRGCVLPREVLERVLRCLSTQDLRASGLAE
ncbi:ankyrin/F-box protein [Orf virus]|nr:ankyrin/F-box protein [Orf virus]